MEAVFKLIVALEDFEIAVRRMAKAFEVLGSAFIIARYPWNPLGTRNYSELSGLKEW